VYATHDQADLADGNRLRMHVPVWHALRQGGRTVSWYRGPFVTGASPADPRFGVRTADELLRYHPDVGMLDIAYAACGARKPRLGLVTCSVAARSRWSVRQDQRVC
jgi:hypothetical protein